MNRPWIAFFSQTGGEIGTLILDLKHKPDLIVTNRSDISDIDILLKRSIEDGSNIALIPNKPASSDYFNILDRYDNPLVTLHGYLRIIPYKVCEKYEMYNLHPGLITEYPELKGKDPQLRAYEGGYEKGGCVIHRVTADVDCGEIISSYPVDIKGCSLRRIYSDLKAAALILWKEFLTRHFKA